MIYTHVLNYVDVVWEARLTVVTENEKMNAETG